MNDKLDPRLPLCVRCGCPEGEPAEHMPAKLDTREVCQHCAYERKERAVIKRWMTREYNDSIERMGINSDIGDSSSKEWEDGYRCALETLRIWLDNRDEKERGR